MINEVSNFELSKKLKQLNFHTKYNFVWMEGAEFNADGSKIVAWHPVLYFDAGFSQELIFVYGNKAISIHDDSNEIVETRGNYPAYTVGQLGEILPREIEHGLNTWSSYDISFGYDGIYNKPGVWYIDDDLWGKDVILHGTGGETEADARCQMLIWLVENKPKVLGDKIKKGERKGDK